MIVIQHNIDTLDRSVVGLAGDRRCGKQVTVRGRHVVRVGQSRTVTCLRHRASPASRHRTVERVDVGAG